MTIAAIETSYAGCRFRSRLEARWAVFFDSVGMTWEYEPQGYVLDGAPYLPDFLLGGSGDAWRMWFEVKGQFPTTTEIRKAVLLAAGTGIDTCLYFGPCELPGPGLSRIGSWEEFMRPVAIVPQWHNEHGWLSRESDAWQWQVGLLPTAFMYQPGMDERRKSGLWWWTDCPHCGRVVMKLDGQVGHCPTLPDDAPDHLISYPNFAHETPRLKRAYKAARSARFEHGESPQIPDPRPGHPSLIGADVRERMADLRAKHSPDGAA